MYRRTQLRDQLSQHDPTIGDNKCKICEKHTNIFKEDTKNALWSCFSLNNLYKDLAKGLDIEKYINIPITIKNVIIWERANSSTNPINLLNSVWTITVNEILRIKETKCFPNVKKLQLF